MKYNRCFFSPFTTDNKQMRRVIQTHMNPSTNTETKGQKLHLDEVLQANLNRIHQLNDWIRLARSKCYFPSKHCLTLDESAALYLLTIKSFYDLTQQDSQSWFPYFQLIRSAIKKLPNTKTNVYRSINKNHIRDDEIIWSNPILCSTSMQIIHESLESDSILCSIETINAKDISMYSQNPHKKEILLERNTRLQVIKHTDNQLFLRELPPIDHHHHHHGLTRFSAQWCNFFMLILAIVLVILTGKTMSTIELFTNQTSQTIIAEMQADSFGNRYEGQYLNGKRHGKGRIEFANGYKYIGDWADDTPTGFGTFIWTNGDYYEGEFEKGQRHGKGSYYFANGDKYVGDWVEDKKHGLGASSLAVGRYEGEFVDDKMHGKGVFYFADGSSYQGEWIDNKQDGHGIFIWINGDRYEGGFKDGKLHGKGSYYFGNGNKFTGEWIDGQRSAEYGSFSWASENNNK